MNGITQTGRWGNRLHAAIVAFAVLVAGAFIASAPRPAHAAPAAGTVIGNQATATYTDAGGTPRTATSNLVQTTVSQVKSFTLATTPQTKFAAAGQTVYYPHTITNTGNGVDTYALSSATSGTFTHTGVAFYIDANGDGVPDNFTPISSSGVVAAGGIFRFVVAGAVPGSAANTDSGTITVTVTDTNAPANTANNVDTTTVSQSAITVTKSLSVTSGPSPGAGAITVTLSYTNSGSAAATALVLTDLINPANGFTYVPNSGRWSGSGATALTDGLGGDPAGIAYDFTANTVTANVANVPAGFSGNVTFQVTVNAGVAAGFVSNTATYTTTQNPSSTSTNTATYQVLRTAAARANASTTDSGPAALDVAGPTPATVVPGSTFTFTNVIWNLGNAADSFLVTMNTTAWTAALPGSTFTLLQSDGVTSLIANTTPSIPVYSAGCAAGFETDAANQRCGYRVIVRVQLPVVAPNGTYSLVTTATSVYDNTKSDTVTDTLTIGTQNTVDLTNDQWRSDTTIGGVPGTATAGSFGHGNTGGTVITTNTVTPSTTGTTTTVFKLYVNNTGAINDSFNLGVSAPPAGWAVAFRADGGALPACSTFGATVTTTGTINAGQARLICAEVTVPATTTGNAAAGTYNLDFTATSALNVAVADVKRDAVTVNAVNSLTLTPNNTQQTFAGGSVTYTHVLTNVGNVTYAVPANPITFAAGFLSNSRAAQGWTAVAYVDTGILGTFEPGIDDVPAQQITTAKQLALAVGASQTIFVRVFAPGAAVSADPANVTTLTASYNAGALTAAVTDSTSVTDGLVMLKEQVAVSCATSAPHAGYSTAPIASGPSTVPGSCIAYRITATNTTAAGITAVVVSDNIPANTRHRVSCGTGATGAATTVGTITAPADGATGTVVATVGPLTPSQSAAVTFCVRIDP